MTYRDRITGWNVALVVLAALAAMVLYFGLAQSRAIAAPLCGERQVPCWNDQKIKDAKTILDRRRYMDANGNPVDLIFIISIEINRGKFHSARALADWIQWGE